MKRLIIIILTNLIHLFVFSQVITTDPAIPLHNQPVTITFHADAGNKGLMNYSGNDVYAHTGAITENSATASDWKYVKAEWTTNLEECKLTKVSANEYQLTISTSIRQFYNVPENEKILKMAFVFRNSNGSRTGRDEGGADIFADVFEEGLQVSITHPAEFFSFALSAQPVQVSISSINSDSLFLYIDNKLIKITTGLSIDTAIIAEGNIKHRIIGMAKNVTQELSDTAFFMIPSQTIEEPVPLELKDGINYITGDSVAFVLFAPGKEFIYLLGDFNGWLPDSIYQLKKEADRFWISLGNLTPQKEYAFQYLIDGDLRIADPYSEKVLDPFNDKFIPEAVYPDLLPYPESKTNQIAGVIQPGQSPYVWGDDSFVPPSQEKLVIYELLIRDFVESHDIKDIKDSLNYLQKLGVNAIELMPFSEFEENSSWGYNPSFYFAVDKFYGSGYDFKDFIKECHNRGIAVIMDIVLNHSYGQSPLVRMYFNSATGKPAPDNPWYNEDSPNSVYNWGYDFNHESDATKYFIDRVLEYWLTEYKIDGFRFDFTKGFTNTPGDGSFYDASRISILKRIYDKLKSVNAGAYMICEHFAPNNEEKELSDYGMMLWGNVNYNYNEATMGYLSNSDFSWVSSKTRGWNNPYLVGYMESHDEERLMYKNMTYGNSSGSYNIKDPITALKRMELAGAFFFTIPGPKMIWQFGELGYDVSIDFNGRLGEKPVKWEYFSNADRKHLYLIWAKILDLRGKYDVFNTDDYTISAGNSESMKKIVLRHEDGDALVIGNFGLSQDEISPDFTSTGWWYEAFSGDSVNVTDVSMNISLEAGEYRIYTAKKMESVINRSVKNDLGADDVFPNPSHNAIFLNTEVSSGIIEIFSAMGTKMLSVEMNTNNQIDISRLSPGYYIIRVTSGAQILTGKFIKQ
ncbi:MAG TPA: alpha-amylase family glycosyl hydrolase [Bacteroidales bacterium]|jgi:glycosidase|nr:alpha-amylase family glycosyl hydrolase [Bacteroidales bacterium]